MATINICSVTVIFYVSEILRRIRGESPWQDAIIPHLPQKYQQPFPVFERHTHLVQKWGPPFSKATYQQHLITFKVMLRGSALFSVHHKSQTLYNCIHRQWDPLMAEVYLTIWYFKTRHPWHGHQSEWKQTVSSSPVSLLRHRAIYHPSVLSFDAASLPGLLGLQLRKQAD